MISYYTHRCGGSSDYSGTISHYSSQVTFENDFSRTFVFCTWAQRAFACCVGHIDLFWSTPGMEKEGLNRKITVTERGYPHRYTTTINSTVYSKLVVHDIMRAAALYSRIQQQDTVHVPVVSWAHPGCLEHGESRRGPTKAELLVQWPHPACLRRRPSESLRSSS